MVAEQLDLFASSYEPFKPKGRIRLIELFAGIGAQAKALENLGVDFVSHRVCEWSCKSIKGYRAIHVNEAPDEEFLERVAKMSEGELIEAVRGVSMDYNKPMTDTELKRKGIDWLRDLYTDMQMIGDYCPDISRLKGKDLDIERERERVDSYVMTYSFPCQSLSNAGRREGMERGSGTRSGLLWEVERILLELKDMECRPDVLLMENVPQVCGTANLDPWNDWLDSLHRMGYTNYFKVLNAKDYAIPQNRERCFMVSILGNGSYVFPSKIKLRYRLKDFLDEGIDERYYLSKKMTERFVNTYKPNGYSSIDSYNKKLKEEPETSNTLTARYQVPNHGERIVEPTICASRGRNPKNPTSRKSGIPTEQRFEVKNDGTSNALTSVQKDNYVVEPKIKFDGSLNLYSFNRADNVISKEGIAPTLDTGGNRIGHQINIIDNKKVILGSVSGWQTSKVLGGGGVSGTLMARDWKDPTKVAELDENEATIDGMKKNLRIRKLTPYECGKLMGFDRSDFEKMYASGLSEVALYHSAGDSIVATVLMGLFGSLLQLDYKKAIESVADRIASEKGRKE